MTSEITGKLSVEQLVHADNKDCIKALLLHYGPFMRGIQQIVFSFPSQKDSDAESVSVSVSWCSGNWYRSGHNVLLCRRLTGRQVRCHHQRPGQPHHILLCGLHRIRASHRRCCQETGGHEPQQHGVRCQASHRTTIWWPVSAIWHETMVLQCRQRWWKTQDLSYKGEDRTFSPEEISAMVLTKMREMAEAYLGQVSSRLFHGQFFACLVTNQLPLTESRLTY